MPQGTYWSGDAYLQSLYPRFGTGASTDPDLLKQYVILLGQRNDLYTKLNKTEVDRQLRSLTEMNKTYQTAQRTAAALAETRAKSSRVTSQNFKDLQVALDKNDTLLAAKMGATTPSWLAASTAFDAANGGKAGLQAAAAALTKWQEGPMGRPLDEASADIAPTMNRFALKALGKNLDQVTPDELVAAVGSTSQSLNERIRSLAQAGKERYEEQVTQRRTTQANRDNLEGIADKYSKLQAGSPGARAIEAQVAQMGNDLMPALAAAYGRSMSDVQAERDILVKQDETLQSQNREVERLRGLVYGADKTSNREKIGRLLATPQFKQWAEGNGFQLGRAEVDENGNLAYSETVDDLNAVALFMYQSKHPGKYGPLFASKTTGALVRVTSDDPQQRAQIMRDYRASDGTYYMDAKDALVRPGEAGQRLEAGGFVPSVERADVRLQDGAEKAYYKLPDGSVIDALTGAAAVAPPDAKFEPATFYPDDKTVRFLTLDDISTPGKVGAIAGQTGVYSEEDRAGLAEYQKNTPYHQVGEDQVRSKWQGTYVGYLDRPHAYDVTSGTGATTITLDGGRVKVPGGQPASIEVISTREPGFIGNVVGGFKQLMDPNHAEAVLKGGVPLDERMDKAERARLEYLGEAPAALEAAGDVRMPYTTPTGVKTELTVPAGSRAPAVAAAGGLPVVPVDETELAPRAVSGRMLQVPMPAPPAPTTAKTAPAAAATPAAEGWRPARRVDKDGNVFELSATGTDNTDAKIKWVATKDGTAPPAGKQTEFVLSKNAKLFEKVYDNLTADAPEPPTLLTKPQAGPPEEPLERRGAAAILQGPERERGPGVLDRVRALFKREPKPGEAAPKDELPAEPEVRPTKKSPYKTTALAGLEGADAKVPEMAPNLEPQFLGAPDRAASIFARLERGDQLTDLTEDEQKRLDQLATLRAPMIARPADSSSRRLLPRYANEAEQIMDAATVRAEAARLARKGTPDRVAGSTSPGALRGEEALATSRRVRPGSSGFVETPYEEAARIAESSTLAAKAADAAKEAQARLRDTAPNPYSMFKKTIGVRPVAPGPTNLE